MEKLRTKFIRLLKFIENSIILINIIKGIGILGLGALIIRFYNILTIFLKNNIGLLLLVVIIFLIIILFYLISINKKSRLSLLFEMNVVSDEQTQFIKSVNDPSLSEAKAVATDIHPNWNYDKKYFNELKNSIWIAHTKKISDEDAINGGIYIFEKKFNIPFDLKKIKFAILYYVVDDYCSINFNQNRVTEKINGNQEIQIVDLIKYIKKDENKLSFTVENENMNGINQKNLINEKDLYRYNPYGIKFCLEIKYLK
jgi:uncharacterized protein (UPF0333 family)